MPSTPSAVLTGASAGSSLRSAPWWTRACVCQPIIPSTQSPGANAADFDATTWPCTVSSACGAPAVCTVSSACGSSL
jgi:hypothetical protein